MQRGHSHVDRRSDLGMTAIGFQDWALLPGEAKLRAAVREFLAAEQVDAACDNWLAGVDPGFSRRLGRAASSA